MSPARKRFLGFLSFLAFSVCLPLSVCLAKKPISENKLEEKSQHSSVEQPVIVNGDNVEYATEKNEITATGNVRVEYQGTKLNCDKLTVNTLTKETIAEGSVVIEDAKGVMHGEKVLYNFNSKRGRVLKGNFASPPFFGTAETMVMSGQEQFSGKESDASTCSFDHPHYHVRVRDVLVVPGDKIQTTHDVLYIGNTPIMFFPRYNHSLRDPFMHVVLIPGHSGDWGPFMLSTWRCNLSDSMNGRIYFDYREKLGFAEGFGTNYTSPVGRGDFKVYYSDEHPTNLDPKRDEAFNRYFGRLRHKWEIGDKDDFVGEYYRLVDEKRTELGSQYSVLKDYFPKEYQADSQPLAYGQFHHSFEHSSVNVLVQERSASWFNQLEKQPEVVYTLPDMQLGNTPFYMQDTTQAANLYQAYAVPSPSTADYSADRFDTYNQLSLPFKAGIFEFSPFSGVRNTYYSSDVNHGSVGPRTVFYTGSGVSTKFYRIFDTPPRFMGMDVHGIRHVVTPSLTYQFNPEPTVSSPLLKQFDALDAIADNNSVLMQLSNKLQTKRDDKVVDFVDLRAETSYLFRRIDPLTRVVTEDRLSDTLDLDLEFLPWNWLRFDADSKYRWHFRDFSEANADLSFVFGPERSIGVGERWVSKQGTEVTSGIDWRIDPKWLFHVYERVLVRSTADTRSGLIRQDYGFTRDLHCWLMDFTYSYEKEHGHTFWFVFRLKAFPANEIRMSQSYASPKSGAQQQHP